MRLDKFSFKFHSRETSVVAPDFNAYGSYNHGLYPSFPVSQPSLCEEQKVTAMKGLESIDLFLVAGVWFQKAFYHLCSYNVDFFGAIICCYT